MVLRVRRRSLRAGQCDGPVPDPGVYLVGGMSSMELARQSCGHLSSSVVSVWVVVTREKGHQSPLSLVWLLTR